MLLKEKKRLLSASDDAGTCVVDIVLIEIILAAAILVLILLLSAVYIRCGPVHALICSVLLSGRVVSKRRRIERGFSMGLWAEIRKPAGIPGTGAAKTGFRAS
jgi:uncharacterized membrane protein YqiK